MHNFASMECDKSHFPSAWAVTSFSFWLIIDWLTFNLSIHLCLMFSAYLKMNWNAFHSFYLNFLPCIVSGKTEVCLRPCHVHKESSACRLSCAPLVWKSPWQEADFIASHCQTVLLCHDITTLRQHHETVGHPGSPACLLSPSWEQMS